MSYKVFHFRLVRLTSPNLNYFIIIGAVVFYSSVYTFFYVPQTSWNLVAIVCNVSELTIICILLCFDPHPFQQGVDLWTASYMYMYVNQNYIKK